MTAYVPVAKAVAGLGKTRKFNPNLESTRGDVFTNVKAGLVKGLAKYPDIPKERRDIIATEMTAMTDVQTMNMDMLAATIYMEWKTRTSNPTREQFNQWVESAIAPMEPPMTVSKEEREEVVERQKADVLRYLRRLTAFRESREV